MCALPVKPGLRHSVADWSANNRRLCVAAAHERRVSTEVRQEGRAMRSHTHSQTSWDESDVSRRLSDRISDVSRWKRQLELCAFQVDEEMEALTLSKEQSEQALAATAVPLEVSLECLAVREGRRGSELVADAVDQNLKTEVELIGRARRALQRHVDEAFEQLCVLQEVRHQLASDLRNKMEALDVDVTCLSLTVKSANISLKTDPTRIPSGSSTPQEWLQFSRANVSQANDAVQATRLMREDMSLTRSQLHNELETQRRATEFALRKRNHQEEQAQDQLQWQIKTTEDEMLEMEKGIHGLDTDLQAKTASLKLVHTRLENRTSRSGMDLCRDEVHLGLVAELQQLEATMGALKQKLSQAQRSLHSMRLHHRHMLQDLSRKQEALSLERRSMSTRLRLAASGGNTTAVLTVPLANASGRSNLQLIAQ